MKRRARVSKGKSKRMFRKSANRVHPMNNVQVKRGGIRL